MQFSTCKLGIHGNILLLYTLSLKLELVCHLVFNRHEIFTLATSIILLRKRVFHFGIALSGVEQCDNKAKVFSECQENLCLSSHCSTPESAIPKWKTLLVKLLK